MAKSSTRRAGSIRNEELGISKQAAIFRIFCIMSIESGYFVFLCREKTMRPIQSYNPFLPQPPHIPTEFACLVQRRYAAPVSIAHYPFLIPNYTHTFSAKEKDTETGYSYFGARYYSSDLSVWLSVDPMSDKYPHLSPFTYCANNPVRCADPNGEEFSNPDDPPKNKSQNNSKSSTTTTAGTSQTYNGVFFNASAEAGVSTSGSSTGQLNTTVGGVQVGIGFISTPQVDNSQLSVSLGYSNGEKSSNVSFSVKPVRVVAAIIAVTGTVILRRPVLIP